MAWGPGSSYNNFNGSRTGAAPAAPQPTAFDGYLGALKAYNAPTFAQYDLAGNQGLRNLGYGQAGYGLNQGQLNLGYQSDLRDLQLRQGTNAIDMRAAQRQPGLIDQLLGLDNQEYGLQRGDADLKARQALFGMKVDETRRGARISTGARQGRRDLYEDLTRTGQHIDVAQNKNTLNAQEQKQQAQDRIDTLNMTASRMGMQGDELKQMLDNRLQQLGLDHAMSTEDLLDGITNNDLQAKQLMLQLIGQAGQYATAK